MLVDLSLARRLERTEGMVGVSFVAARPSDSPIRPVARELGGTIAVFNGVDWPLTQTFGLGMQGVPAEADLATIEAFFTERGADTMPEVSPFAGVETFAMLVARGYRPIEIVQPIDEPGRVHAHQMASRESRGVKASRTRSRDTCVAVGVRTAAQVSQIRRGTCLA